MRRRGPAYVDFVVRLKEIILLARLAKNSSNASDASTFSKSAAVLLAAALERYVNSSLNDICGEMKVETWNELPIGSRRYLCYIVARKIGGAISKVDSLGEIKDKDQERLRRIVNEADEAFRKPCTWKHIPEYGMFMEGAAEPERLNSLLKKFHPKGKALFETLEEVGWDKSMLGRSLSDLIDTRHAVAHALPDRNPPSPKDITLWVYVVFVVVRGIEAFYAEAIN